MIEQIRLKNFQSHSDSALDFSPGVNIIVGESDQGKTSILRAIYWLWSNRPTGDDFIRHGEKSTSVEASVSGAVIGRVRGGGKNYYEMDGHRFEAPGRNGPPEEISRALNISDINWQLQMDPPFLLGDSPAEVARYINKLVDLESINHTISGIRSILTGEEAERKRLETNLNDDKARLVEFDWVAGAEGELVGLEVLEKAITACEDKRRGLSELLSRVQSLTKEVVELTTPIRVERLIDELSSIVSLLSRDKRLADRLYELLEKADEINDQLEAAPVIKRLLDSAGILSKGQNQTYNLSKYLDQADRLFKETMNLSAEVKLLKEQIAERTPAVCPICGQEWGRKNERYDKK